MMKISLLVVSLLYSPVFTSSASAVADLRPMPSGISETDFVLTKAQLDAIVLHGKTYPYDPNEAWGQTKFAWMLQEFFKPVWLGDGRLWVPAPEVSHLFWGTLNGIDKKTEIKRLARLIKLNRTEVAALRTPPPSNTTEIPLFVRIFDRVLSQVAQLDREHWSSALVMFKIMIEDYPDFDRWDLLHARSPLPTTDAATPQYMKFHDWPGSLMNENYIVIYDLVKATWEWGELLNERATMMITEFDPSALTQCFQPWYFNTTATGEPLAPSMEKFPEIVARMTTELPPFRVRMEHECLLKKLLFEYVWIPGRFNRSRRQEDATIAVTEMLYLLRMVSGANAYVSEVE